MALVTPLGTVHVWGSPVYPKVTVVGAGAWAAAGARQTPEPAPRRGRSGRSGGAGRPHRSCLAAAAASWVLVLPFRGPPGARPASGARHPAAQGPACAGRRPPPATVAAHCSYSCRTTAPGGPGGARERRPAPCYHGPAERAWPMGGGGRGAHGARRAGVEAWRRRCHDARAGGGRGGRGSSGRGWTRSCGCTASGPASRRRPWPRGPAWPRGRSARWSVACAAAPTRTPSRPWPGRCASRRRSAPRSPPRPGRRPRRPAPPRGPPPRTCRRRPRP